MCKPVSKGTACRQFNYFVIGSLLFTLQTESKSKVQQMFLLGQSTVK